MPELTNFQMGAVITIGLALIVVLIGLVIYLNRPSENGFINRNNKLPATPVEIINALSNVDKFDDAPPGEAVENLTEMFLPNFYDAWAEWIEDNGGVVQRIEGGANVWISQEYIVSNEDVEALNPDINIRELFDIGKIYDEVFLKLLIVTPNGKIAGIFIEHDKKLFSDEITKRSFLAFPNHELTVRNYGEIVK